MNIFLRTTLSFYFKNHVSTYPKGQKQLVIANRSVAQSDKWKDRYGFQAHTYGNYQRSATNKKLADWMLSKPLLISFFAALILLVEVCRFVVLINSRWRNLYLITVILMHTSIGILMGLYFTKYRLICFCLMDWKLIFNGFQKKYSSLFRTARTAWGKHSFQCRLELFV